MHMRRDAEKCEVWQDLERALAEARWKLSELQDSTRTFFFRQVKGDRGEWRACGDKQLIDPR